MAPSSVRRGVIAALAECVPPAAGDGCVRVAIDGVDGSGKSILAAELAAALSEAGRPVIQVSADDWHQQRAQRHARGRTSPEGFWLDSYDYPRLRAEVLEPLGPGGSREYRPLGHSLETDEVLRGPTLTAPEGAVVVVDGLFLQRAELHGCFEFVVWLDVPFEETARRMAVRDGTPPHPDDPAMARYVGGQRRYFAACAPWSSADLVIDNTDVERPRIVEAALD
jgi:uridine kinase